VLSTDEAVALLAWIVGEQRVAAELEAAAELAEVCGHLPRALRIAAAQLTGQRPRSIAGYLTELRAGDRLAGLEIDGDPRAAVRPTFDSS
jgi:3-dehydroquinate synthase class II